MFIACENVCRNADELIMESSALLVPKNKRAYVDVALTNMGLESTTILSMQISQEGVFEWVKEKLSKLGRSISLSVNKIYAKLTRADNDVKKLLERAENDETVELPISGKKITLIGSIAVAAAVVISLSCKAAFSKDESGEQKSKEYYNKFKKLISDFYHIKDESDNVKSNIVKEAFGKVRKAISSINSSISEFFAGFKKTAQSAEGEVKNGNKEIVDRVRRFGKAVKQIFSSVVIFVRTCCSKKVTDDIVLGTQVVVLDIRAVFLHKYGLSSQKALFLLGSSQFYWTGTNKEWKKIKSTWTFGAPMKSPPEKKTAAHPEDLRRLMVVYKYKGPLERIEFSKGGIAGFMQRYTTNHPDESGYSATVYFHPKMEGNIMKYGFKDE